MKHLVDLYSSGLMRRALFEAILIGLLCGAVGVHVFVRRLPFFAHAIAHASFPGVVLALIVGVGWITGSLVFTAALIVLIWLAGFDRRLSNSTIVGVALSASFAAGVVLQSTQRNFRRDLSSILVGQIAGVEPNQIAATAVIGVIIIGVLVALHKELVLSAFDHVEATVLGRGRALDLAALLIVGATVVVAVPAVGTILAAALLTVPPMAARLVTRRIGSAMIVSALIGALAGVIGLTASAEWDVAAGASIALAATSIFAAVAAGRAAVRALRREMIVLTDVGSTGDAAG